MKKFLFFHTKLCVSRYMYSIHLYQNCIFSKFLMNSSDSIAQFEWQVFAVHRYRVSWSTKAYQTVRESLSDDRYLSIWVSCRDTRIFVWKPWYICNKRSSIICRIISSIVAFELALQPSYYYYLKGKMFIYSRLSI